MLVLNRPKGIVTVLGLLSLMFIFYGCKTTDVGNSISGYKVLDGVHVQPSEAVDLASPYLDTTYDLRNKDSDLPRGEDSETRIIVSLRNGYYHVVKESYPAMSAKFYLDHAVKVDADTGAVIPPE
ncbi:MAG: hypothetical protein KJ060_00160 [Candidatus Hydrogenedentes bacterium]|nr:hypothetical protein [Candidatus Hydrogenedentota bacterium]